MNRVLRVLALVIIVTVQGVPLMAAQASPASTTTMEPALYEAFIHAAAKDGPVLQPEGAGYSLNAQGLQLNVNARGLSVAPATGPAWIWDIQLKGFGREGSLGAVSAPKTAQANGRGELAFGGGLTEWFRSTGVGLEQGFDISQAPRGNGQLVLHMQLDTSLNGALTKDNRSLRFDAGNGQVLHYDGLRVFDAKGRELDAKLVYTAKDILIQIDDRAAAYPLTVDPLIYWESEVIASDGAAQDSFGASVAVSGDTAVVGAPYHATVGAAYVFERSGAAWIEKAELTASDGALNDRFGSVAIAGDTIVVGAVGANAAYVYVKPVGGWANSLETAILTASDGGAGFGAAVATTGSVIVVGAPFQNTNAGEAYVFVKPGGGWATATENARLTASDHASDDNFGLSVAISGNTICIGAPEHNSHAGEAYIFLKPFLGWTTGTETARLTASDGAGVEHFGASVGVSGDTVVAGAWYHNSGAGEAYVFVRPQFGWTTGTETARLTASDAAPNSFLGWSAGISGNTIVIGSQQHNGAIGEAYVFVRPGGTWVTGTETYRLRASDESIAQYGNSVSISGSTILVGAPVKYNIAGAAYFYYSDYTSSDLLLAASASSTTPNVGDTITLTASVSNLGPDDAPAVSVKAPLPDGLTYVSSSMPYGGLYDPASGVWSAGSLAFGATATLSIKATVGANAPITQPVFTASLQGFDTYRDDNTASVALTVPLLSFTASASAFGNQLIGTASPGIIVTATEKGQDGATLGTLSVPSPFVLSNDGCSSAYLNYLDTCTFTLQFVPMAPVSYSGSVTIPVVGSSPVLLPLSSKGVLGTQLLTNRSFESGSPVPTDWVQATSWTSSDGRDCTVAHSGACSLKFNGTGASRMLAYVINKSGVAGDDYLFAVFRKATSVPGGAALNAQIITYNGASLVGTQMLAMPTGTYGWNISALAWTMSTSYTQVIVLLQYNGSSGTAWFDDAWLSWAP